jgi:DNA-binding YbaB/EbfC family protein
MNMQAMLKQAQKMQQGLLAAQKEIEAMEFEGKSSIVTVKMDGKKVIKSISIDSEGLEKDEIEMLEDMLMVAINDAMKQVDKTTEDKMGPYTKGLPAGLF